MMMRGDEMMMRDDEMMLRDDATRCKEELQTKIQGMATLTTFFFFAWMEKENLR